MRRIPIIPTIIVAAAVVTMIALGFWQLDRMGQKEALLAHYARTRTMSSSVPFPQGEGAVAKALYRHSEIDCTRVLSRRSVPGIAFDGRTGLAQMVRCALPDGREADVALGFSVDPAPAKWDGGKVIGFLAPDGKEAKLIAAPPQAGLGPLKQPDPSAIPNNHLAYAVQWFLFALTALVIYGFALRKRWRQA